MNVPLLLVAVILALAIDQSLMHALALATTAPSLTMILVVFLALHAPRDRVLWLGWGIGLLIDLVTVYPHGGVWGDLPVLGPNALGWCFGAYVVMLVRAMLYRRQLHTIAVMTVVFAIASNLVSVFVLAVHGLYEPVPILWTEGGPVRGLLERLGSGLFTSVLALLVGPLLQLSLPAWRFRQPLPRAVARRA